MWCAACRADVAAELSADNRRMLCARCQSELGTAVGALDRPVGPRLQDTERNARELLARWSTQHLLEPPITAVPSPSIGPAESAPIKSVHRFDAAHSSVPAPRSESADSADDAETKRRRRKTPRRPHLTAVSQEEAHPVPPHDELVRMAVHQPTERHGNWTTSIGQLCAYGGVGLLTLGTVMVLSGYFGVETNYAPTGWLVATVGQMLLFLGVVTLVSGGMEQTVDEVAWRIDHLAGQISHLEQMMNAQQAMLTEMERRERRRNRLSGRGQSDAA